MWRADLPRFSRRSLATTLLAGSCACGTREKDKTQILGKLSNARFNLSCEFIGQVVSDPGTAAFSAIDKIVFRDLRSGDWQELVPADSETLRAPGGKFYPMWSPDETLFALPLDRLDGFRFLPAARLLQALREGTSRDRIRVQFDTGSRLWHRFIGWKSFTVFAFTAGPPSTPIPFTYDLVSGALRCPKTTFQSDFSGFSDKGEVEPILT